MIELGRAIQEKPTKAAEERAYQTWNGKSHPRAYWKSNEGTNWGKSLPIHHSYKELTSIIRHQANIQYIKCKNIQEKRPHCGAMPPSLETTSNNWKRKSVAQMTRSTQSKKRPESGNIPNKYSMKPRRLPHQSRRTTTATAMMTRQLAKLKD